LDFIYRFDNPPSSLLLVIFNSLSSPPLFFVLSEISGECWFFFFFLSLLVKRFTYLLTLVNHSASKGRPIVSLSSDFSLTLLDNRSVHLLSPPPLPCPPPRWFPPFWPIGSDVSPPTASQRLLNRPLLLYRAWPITTHLSCLFSVFPPLARPSLGDVSIEQVRSPLFPFAAFFGLLF